MWTGAVIGPVLYAIFITKDKGLNKRIPFGLLMCIPLIHLRFNRLEGDRVSNELKEGNLFDYNQKSRKLKTHLKMLSEMINENVKK